MSPQQRKSFQSTFANLAQQSGQNAVTGSSLEIFYLFCCNPPRLKPKTDLVGLIETQVSS